VSSQVCGVEEDAFVGVRTCHRRYVVWRRMHLLGSGRVIAGMDVEEDAFVVWRRMHFFMSLMCLTSGRVIAGFDEAVLGLKVIMYVPYDNVCSLDGCV